MSSPKGNPKNSACFFKDTYQSPTRVKNHESFLRPCVCISLASGILHRVASHTMSHPINTVGLRWPLKVPPRTHRGNANLKIRVYSDDTFCHLTFSVLCRAKHHARFFSLQSSQTNQEMRKLKINPIKNNYFLSRWMCSTCVRADNTFNNFALQLICVEMVFEFSERSKWSKYQKSSRAVEGARYKRNVMQEGIDSSVNVGFYVTNTV